MKRTATALVALTWLIICPVAQADPALGAEDANYTKWLSENGVNYQGRVPLQTMIAQAHTTCTMLDQNPTPQGYQATVSRLVGGPANFTQHEAELIVHSAVNSYCGQHTSLLYQ